MLLLSVADLQSFGKDLALAVTQNLAELLGAKIDPITFESVANKIANKAVAKLTARKLSLNPVLKSSVQTTQPIPVNSQTLLHQEETATDQATLPMPPPVPSEFVNGTASESETSEPLC